MAQGGLGSLWGAILGAFGAGPASGTIEAITGTALETFLGPSLNEAKQYAEAYFEKPKNHDLERSLRFAALLACLHLILEQKSHEEAEAAMERGKPPDTFCPAARKWVHGQLLALGEVQDGAHRESVATYQASLNTALASQPDLRDAARAAEDRKTAEKNMWQELVDALPDQQFPTDFEARFMGTNGDGWFGYFIIFLREALKNQDNARHAFFIGGLSDLQNAVTRIEEAQAQLLQGQRGIQLQLSESEAAANQRHAELLAAIARDKGVPIAPLQAVLARLGDLNVAPEQIPARLEAAATRLLELERTLAQPIQGDAASQAARDDARRMIDQGDFEAAAAKLRQGRQEARQRREDSQRIEATMAADEAGLAKLALRYRDAAALFAEAADLVRFDAKASWAHLLEQADALYLHGSEFGDNAALAESIEIHKQALALAPRDRVPLDWAATQNELGNALATLGAREAGTARLEEAVTAYRAALEEYTRDRVPLDWAMTQNNLGAALRNLGEREAGTALLEEAVTAYREALKEYTRDRVPLDWAMTQNNLGIALRELGEREAGTARLEEAVTAYCEALKEYTRDRVPLDWAMTQNNLGTALQTLGKREAGTVRLQDAVTAYREALKERTRNRVPLNWAGTQNNLGVALSELGEREAGTARLEEAVTAYREALKEYTRDRVPLQWAIAQDNLGNALSELGERAADSARLEEAVTAYRAALEERTRDRVPLQWAATQNNLGNALSDLGEREPGTERLEDAVTAYRAALEEYTRDRVPLHWAYSQYGLANCLATLAERSPTPGPILADAITHMQNAVDGYQQVGDKYWRPIAEKRLAKLKAKAQ
jgi:tetratricopeptide (TPR) repeat protein